MGGPSTPVGFEKGLKAYKERTQESAPADKPDAKTDTQAQVAPDTSTESADLTKDQDTESPPENDDADEGDDAESAPGEGDDADDGEDNVELSEEELASLAEGYQDKLLSQKPIQEKVAELVREQLAQEQRAQQQAQEGQQAVSAAIERSKQAVTDLLGLANQASTELARVAKAAKADEDGVVEPFDVNSDIFKPDQMAQHLQTYGEGIVAEVSTRYDTAFLAGADRALTDVLPELTEKQEQDYLQIVSNAGRIASDPNQGVAASKAYFMGETIKFLVERAKEAGAIEERERVSKRTTATKKIADKAATKAAAAKLAKDRGKVSPPTGKATPEATGEPETYDSDYFMNLMREGKKDEARAYAKRVLAKR